MLLQILPDYYFTLMSGPRQTLFPAGASSPRRLHLAPPPGMLRVERLSPTPRTKSAHEKKHHARHAADAAGADAGEAAGPPQEMRLRRHPARRPTGRRADAAH